jgi:ankyrin repeat protein
MFAAMKGHTEAVQRLIENGADLEIQSSQRWTTLMYAVRTITTFQNFFAATKKGARSKD